MIYIVRHGETNWNLIGRNQGQTDIPLNNTGIIQANKTAEILKGTSFDLVFSSPLKRAHQTAKIITAQPIILDQRLIERFNGDLQGMYKKDYKDLVDFSSEKETGYNIEKLSLFRKRINDFFDEITQKYPNKNILVVTHAGVSIYAKCYFEGEPSDNNYMKYKLNNCEVLMYKN